MDFHTWLEQKYDEWSNGGKKSVNQFALYLEISQPTVNAWITHSRGAPKSRTIINKLLVQYGDEKETYDAIGIPHPITIDVTKKIEPIASKFSPHLLEQWVALGSEMLKHEELEGSGYILFPDLPGDIGQRLRAISLELFKLADQKNSLDKSAYYDLVANSIHKIFQEYGFF
jgi:hypothetical protein